MTNVKEIIGLENLDTTDLTSMKNMFYNCENLESISGLWGFNTENVEDMSHMFYGCKKLKLGKEVDSLMNKFFPDVINARSGYVTTDEFGELTYKIKPLNEYVK